MFLKLVIDMEIQVLTKSEDLQFWEEILGRRAWSSVLNTGRGREFFRI